MDEIEVDPKLFVTCRLCLEDLGQYQIVPNVQHQIKYCFDIEVEPFDGLPQLICMKCKDILNKFHTIKNTFCEKQTNLINKVIISRKDESSNIIQPQQDTVSSSQQVPENIDNSKKKKTKKKRVLQLSSSSDLESEQSFHASKPRKKKSSRPRVTSPIPWEAEYTKLILCKLCNSVWQSRRSLACHMRCHELLREKYKNILNRHCTVNLIKIDDKPNITRSSNLVVYSSNKIIAPGNSNFSAIYSKDTNTNQFNINILQNQYENRCLSREASDDEGIVLKRTLRKRRLISRSSNETVVIESHSNKMVSDCEEEESIDGPLNAGQCINIEDSSESESDLGKLENSQKVKQPMEAKLGDYKIIQGIISMCVNSYHKKNDMLYMNVGQNKNKEYNVQISSESQLKHKVLSIGRKIINKQSFNCTGLLRYMEHKSLEIVWLAKTQSLYSKDTNYIRILTKLRGHGNLDDDLGWVNVSEMSESMSNPVVNNSTNIVALNRPLSTVPVSNDSVNDATAAKIATSALANMETSQLEQINNQAKILDVPAMLYLDSKASISDLKKLLNANPVANPKQLPKKLGPGNESRCNKTVAQQSLSQTTNDDNNFCLPIITSTTSLATVPDKEQNQGPNHKNSVTSGVITNTETLATLPRIKVKPASELMSERALNSLMKEQTTPVTNNNMLVSQIENVWPQQLPMNVFVPNIAPQMNVASPPLQILQMPTLNTGSTYQESSNIIQPQQDTVSSSQQAPENIDDSKKKKTKKKRVLQLSSSSDLESEQSFHASKPRKKKSSRPRVTSPIPWEAEYTKLILCKLCDSVWPSRRSLACHMRCHELLRARYKNILNRHCTVNLIKIDDKPNITGSSNLVVYSSNKIIAPGNSNFSAIYSKDSNTNQFNSNILQNEYENRCLSQESSDDEGIVLKRTQRKKRLISRSSNETVVIESNSNKIVSDCEEDSKMAIQNSIDVTLNAGQCINIEDSSESESDLGKLENSQKVKQPMEAKLGDYKIIQGIISMCVNSYHKKNELAEVDMLYMNVGQNKKKEYNVQISNESQLKHKVLSIGRKIINKQGFNCTGLLRYMEHKSLEIVWLAKTQSLYSKDTNYIRILTKLRGHGNLDDDLGWVNVSEMSESMSNPVVNNSTNIVAPNRPLSTVPVSNDSVNDATAAKIATSALANMETSQLEPINNQAKSLDVPAMLYLDSKASSSDLKKLLNANPVANPKQLPKKLGPGNESRCNKTVAQQSLSQTTNDDNNFCLPIITSTTSLATVPDKEQNQDPNHKNSVTSGVITNTETLATLPRIKVKPASELMSERTLNSLMKEQTTPVTNNNMLVSQIENVWPHQLSMNVFVPNIAPQMNVASPPLQIFQMPTLNTGSTYQVMPNAITSTTKQDYVILDTTDFPNTKTESPIKYVKNLLQMHNIFLLDPCETLSKEFICLIKFKVVFKQDYQKDSPLILCLSLSCFKNTFCFQVRDRNQQCIDMTKISANWQWEILQTYRGDVSNKVLQNARKFGQEVFDLTNNFFCLLKAINCRKP